MKKNAGTTSVPILNPVLPALKIAVSVLKNVEMKSALERKHV